MGLTKAEKYNKMMDKVFRGVEEIDKKAKCPKCRKSITRERGLGTLLETCSNCGYFKFEGRGKK